MRKLIFLVMLVFGLTSVYADYPPKVQKIIDAYQTDVEKGQKKFKKAKKKAKKKALEALGKEKNVQMKQKGDLDAALAIDRLIKNFPEDGEEPEVEEAQAKEVEESDEPNPFDKPSEPEPEPEEEEPAFKGRSFNLLKGGVARWEADRGQLTQKGRGLSATGAGHMRACRKLPRKMKFRLNAVFGGKGHDKVFWIGDTSVVFRVSAKQGWGDVLVGEGGKFGSIKQTKVANFDLSVPHPEQGNKQIARQRVVFTVNGKVLEVRVNGKVAVTVDGDYRCNRVGFGVWHARQSMDIYKMSIMAGR